MAVTWLWNGYHIFLLNLKYANDAQNYVSSHYRALKQNVVFFFFFKVEIYIKVVGAL